MNPERAAPAPHPPLPRYYGEAADRDLFVRNLFDAAASSYDQINSAFSFGSGAWYRRDALRRSGLVPGHRFLDVAIGTGLVAREALNILGRPDDMMGLDLSDGMLREAQKALPINLIQARAEAIPLAEESIDFVSMGYALRHVPDLVAAFREYRRVLRPNGHLLLLEIGRPESATALKFLRFYMGRLVPAMSRWMGGGQAAKTMMSYYWDTIEACVPPATIEAALGEAGFEGIGCDVQLGIFRAYRARKPAP
jgi:demethylmenaquinone methyltransferase/2-methoxy-6-polyprenyl-1,4-benzoquinol methylase